MAAGEVGGLALSLGLIDYVAIDLVPVVFGRGKPYFGTIGFPVHPVRDGVNVRTGDMLSS